MKFILSAALLAALAMPLGASAQQVQYPTAPQTGAPAQGGQQVPRIYRRWSTLLQGLNLSNQQHDQIQTILDQYAQAHPVGSAHDPSAARMLREQIFAVLTPQQQTQLRDNMQAAKLRQAQLRVQRLQQQQQMQEQPGGSYPAPVTTTRP